MPENVTNELIYEILKQMQGKLISIEQTLDEHTRQFIGVRELLHTMEGNSLRQERMIASLQLRIERIENRLSLNDLPH